MSDLAAAINLIEQGRKSTLQKTEFGQQLLNQKQLIIDKDPPLLCSTYQKRSNPTLDMIHSLYDKISGKTNNVFRQNIIHPPQPVHQGNNQTNNTMSEEMQRLLQQKQQIDEEMHKTFDTQPKTQLIQSQQQQQSYLPFQNKSQDLQPMLKPAQPIQDIPEQQQVLNLPSNQPQYHQNYQEQNYQNIITQLKNQIGDLEKENKQLKEQLFKQQDENKIMKEDFNKQLAELEYQIMNMQELGKQHDSPGRKIIQAYADQNTQLLQTNQVNKIPVNNIVVQQQVYQSPVQQNAIPTQQQNNFNTSIENNILTQSAGSLALELASQQAQNDINQNGISEFDKKWKELEEIEAQQEQLRQQRSKIIDEQMKENAQQHAIQQRSSLFAQNVIQRERQQEKQTELLNKIQSNNSQVVYKHQCTKILLPESTGLKEQAAKRIIILEKTNEGPILAWYRQNGNELQLSGIMQLAQIVNVAAAEQAQLFRSKVLAARKAGYVNDIFDLIGQGIIDQLEPASLVRAPCSVIFFTDNAVLCFDFGSDKEEFEVFCKALLDLGV